MGQNMLFLREKPKILPVYLLPLALSLWGIGNAFYWEVYKGYSACTICAWHRGIYIALFILLLILFKYRRIFIKLLISIALVAETLVSLIQVFKPCSPLICKHVSLVEQLNLFFVSVNLILIFIFELRAYLKYQKKLRSHLKHVVKFSHFKIDPKLN